MIARINKFIVRHYRDNDSTVAYAEWTDTKGRSSRTEAPIVVNCDGSWQCLGDHMTALFLRSKRDAAPLIFETW